MLDQLAQKQQLVAEEKQLILDRVRLTQNAAEAAQDAPLVIENAPENLEVKRKIFAKFDCLCPEETILSTNSSAIRVSSLENATKRPDKVLNLHFYAPVWSRPMVELMGGTKTSEDTLDRVRRFARDIGLVPLMVRRESTGFIFNRIWHAIKMESMTVVDSGVASIQDVDRAWMIATGMRIGPFGLMDMIGLDVVSLVAAVYYEETQDDRDRPPTLLTDKIKRGEFGVKTGKGFYHYPDPQFHEPGFLKDDVK
jgi:3-hydroxybutyryl-CoA dehydrogenase